MTLLTVFANAFRRDTRNDSRKEYAAKRGRLAWAISFRSTGTVSQDVLETLKIHMILMVQSYRIVISGCIKEKAVDVADI